MRTQIYKLLKTFSLKHYSANTGTCLILSTFYFHIKHNSILKEMYFDHTKSACLIVYVCNTVYAPSLIICVCRDFLAWEATTANQETLEQRFIYAISKLVFIFYCTYSAWVYCCVTDCCNSGQSWRKRRNGSSGYKRRYGEIS